MRRLIPLLKPPRHTPCDSHSLCRPAYNMKSVILNIVWKPIFITCSIRLWTSQWGGQRSRAPALPPRCSSGSWQGCCKPSRAGIQSVAWLNSTIPFGESVLVLYSKLCNILNTTLYGHRYCPSAKSAHDAMCFAVGKVWLVLAGCWCWITREFGCWISLGFLLIDSTTLFSCCHFRKFSR